MIYPRKIFEYVHNNPAARRRFGRGIQGRPLNMLATGIIDNSDEFIMWMRREGVDRDPEIKRYILFMREMKGIYDDIYMDWVKPSNNSGGEKDSNPIQTTVEEMLNISRYLYYLDSYGIKGDMLECGCFKGFSSCCLSHACDYLDKKLIVADSFEGLPDIKHPFYKKGDFKGEFEEVKNNIAKFGSLRSVEFIKGWYDISLKGFNRPLCLIWIDVDLYQSILDVLNNVFPNLSQEGVIFSHEFPPQDSCDYGNNEHFNQSEVLRAVRDFFAGINASYTIKYISGNTGIIVPHEKGKLLFDPFNTSLLGDENLFVSDESDLLASTAAPKSIDFHVDCIDGMQTGAEPVKIKNDSIVVSGWAIDSFSKMPAGGVFLTVDGRIFRTTYGFERKDVALACKNDLYTHCGFRGTIPAAIVGHGQHAMSLKILSNDRKACYTMPSSSIIVSANE